LRICQVLEQFPKALKKKIWSSGAKGKIVNWIQFGLIFTKLFLQHLMSFIGEAKRLESACRCFKSQAGLSLKADSIDHDLDQLTPLFRFQISPSINWGRL
jgi:hypothetical protein